LLVCGHGIFGLEKIEHLGQARRFLLIASLQGLLADESFQEAVSMSHQFVLYAYPFPTRAERVIWTLNELGYAYELVRLNPFDEEWKKNPALLNINPSGKVPALIHNGKLLTESLAIMEYLVALAGRDDLIPKDIDDLYVFRRLVYYIATEIEPYLWVIDQSTRLNALYDWPGGADQTSRRLTQKNVEWIYTILDKTTYIAGSQFTLADIYAHNVLSWANKCGITRSKRVVQYMQNLEARQSFPLITRVGVETQNQ
jgi:glutathione S-transferase